MNTITGEIKNFSEEDLKELKELWISIDEKDMTTKQKETLQVSKFDNRSKLGQIYTNYRKLTRKQKNRLKRGYI